jgi:hypothetical protein
VRNLNFRQWMNEYIMNNANADLGALLSEHPVSRVRQIIAAFSPLSFIVASLLVTVLAFLPDDSGASKPPLRNLFASGILLLVGIGLAVYLYPFIFQTVSYRFYENGLERTTLTGRLDHYRWSDVTSVTDVRSQMRFGQALHAYRMVFQDGRKATITSVYRDFDRTGFAILAQKTGLIHLPTYKDFF